MKKLILFFLVFICLQIVFCKQAKDSIVFDDKTETTIKEIFRKKAMSISLQWSAAACKGNRSLEKAQEYCDNLVEGGYDDWRLPTIDELRTLIKDCPQTKPDGSCGVDADHLSEKYWTKECRMCSKDPFVKSGLYKFEKDPYYWSSSFVADSRYKERSAWVVFLDGENISPVRASYVYDAVVRCVRKYSEIPKVEESTTKELDLALCKKARNDSNTYGWAVYTEIFPNGECATEAEEALDKEDCEMAKYKNSPITWDMYLKKHPQGQCRNEADRRKQERNNLEKHWSERSQRNMTWNEAVIYCKILDEGGYNDWRLPTLDELKTLINTETEDIKNCSYSRGHFSKLNDNDSLWSFDHWSFSDGGGKGAALIDFNNGKETGAHIHYWHGYVRCIR